MGIRDIFFNIYKSVDSTWPDHTRNPDLERIDSNTSITRSIYKKRKTEKATKKKEEKRKEKMKKKEEIQKQLEAQGIEDMLRKSVFKEYICGRISKKEWQVKTEKANLEKMVEREIEFLRPIEEKIRKRRHENNQRLADESELWNMHGKICKRYGLRCSTEEWAGKGEEDSQPWVRLLGNRGMNGGFGAAEQDEDEIDGEWDMDAVSVREIWC